MDFFRSVPMTPREEGFVSIGVGQYYSFYYSTAAGGAWIGDCTHEHKGVIMVLFNEASKRLVHIETNYTSMRRGPGILAA